MFIKVDSKLNLFDQKVHGKHNSICKFGLNVHIFTSNMLMNCNGGIYINVCLSLSTLFKEEVMKVYFNEKK